MAPRRPWYSGTFARTALPMFGFVVVCWYGLEQLVDSKLKIRQSVRGYDKVEEYDPLERIRRLEGAGDNNANSSSRRPRGGSGGSAVEGSGGQSGGRGAAAAANGGGSSSGTAKAYRSLEEELAELQASINIKDFDYKPVPRPEDDEY